MPSPPSLVIFRDWLTQFLEAWSLITSDTWAQTIVAKGYRLEFTSSPLCYVADTTIDNLSPELEELGSLLEKGTIEPVQNRMGKAVLH